MKPLTAKQRFPGSFNEFDRLLFRIPDRGRWLPRDGRRVYFFTRKVTVTWFERPKGYLVEGEDRMHVLFIDAEIRRLMKRLGLITTDARKKPSSRVRRVVRVADTLQPATLARLRKPASGKRNA